MRASRTRGGRSWQPAAPDTFDEFTASVLFCDRCRVAQPVRERRLLYLPDGELWEYLCSACGASVGTRRTTAGHVGIVA